jgi:hypothetical protein
MKMCRCLDQQGDRLDDHVHAGAERGEPVPDDLGRERAVGVGEVSGVDLRAPVQQQCRDHQEYPQQYEPGGAGVRPGEPGFAADAPGVGAQPDDRERDDARQHRHGEQVLDEPEDRPVADDRNRERGAEQVTVGLDDCQQQDGETPERQRMGGAGHRPLEQLPLPDHLGGLDPHVPARVLPHRRDPLRRGLASTGHPVQPPHPPPGERKGNHCQHKPDDDTQDHADLLMRRRPRRGAGGIAGPALTAGARLAGPLPVQGTPHTVPAEFLGDAGARCTPAISASHLLVT